MSSNIFSKERKQLTFKKLIISLLMFLVMVILPSSVVFADDENDSEKVGFYVSAQIPDNQIDTSLTYFDLCMQPSMKQTLAVSIINTSAEDIILDISAISASTNQNGLIDYRTPDIRDETLNFPFSELASIQNSEITVAANGSATAYVDLVMPEQTYDGVILGGIVISRQHQPDDEAADTGQGSIIYNQYAYVLGVKLNETDTPVKPEFELFNAKADVVDYRAAIVHYLRNKKAAIVKNMGVSLAITENKTKEIIIEDKWTIDMAPNSVIQLPAFTDMDLLEAGEYTSRMTLTGEKDEDKDTVLQYTFTIDKEDLESVKTGVVEGNNENKSFPLWAWIIITLLAILILLLGLRLLLLLKRRKSGKKG